MSPLVRGDYRTEASFESRTESQGGRGKGRVGDAQRDRTEQVVEATSIHGGPEEAILDVCFRKALKGSVDALTPGKPVKNNTRSIVPIR